MTTIERLNNPSACPAIAFDPAGKTGAITQDAEIDCFTRAGGAVGQRYQVRVVETSGAATLLFEVVRPDGTTVCGPTGATDASCLLDAAGTHRIYVYCQRRPADRQLPGRGRALPQPGGCAAGVFGDSVGGDDQQPGRDRLLHLRRLLGRPHPLPRDPDLGRAQPDHRGPAPRRHRGLRRELRRRSDLRPRRHGQHTLIVREGAGNGEATGTAAVRIERLNNPSACPAIAFDPAGKTGAITQDAEIDCFTRAGGAVGQRYQVRVVETSGAATLLFEVVRPDGSTVCGPTGATDASCLLDAAGTHRIYVYSSGGLQTANYRVVVERFPNPVGCAAGDSATPQVRTIDNPGEIDCFTFAGTAGERRPRARDPDSRRAQPDHRGPAPRRHRGLRGDLRRRSDLRPRRQRRAHADRPRGRRQRRGDGTYSLQLRDPP